jgi:hypothetical protein
MKKIIFILLSVLLIFTGILIYRNLKGHQGPSGEQLLPPNTMIYSGSRNALKVGAGLKFSDFSDELQNCGLTPEESRKLDQWMKTLRGVQFGLSDVTLLPFSLDAVIILEGRFSSPLTEALPEKAAARFETDRPHREVAIQRLTIPVGDAFLQELYVSDPVRDRIFITMNRSLMTETIDRLIDGGPSLADSPDFQEMAAIPEIRKQDVMTYMDLQQYLDLLFGLAKTIPNPAIQQGVRIAREELRLDEWGPTVSGQSFLGGTSVSFSKMPEDLPLYQQFQYSRPAEPTGVPAGTVQVTVMQIKNAALARKQLTDLIERIVARAAPLSGMQLPAHPVQLAEQLLGFSLSEIDPLLSGEILFCQSAVFHTGHDSNFTVGLGITDADAVQQFIQTRLLSRLGLQPIERNGVQMLAGVDTLAWSIQPGRLLIASSPETLADVLRAGTPKLPDSSGYQEMRSRLPEQAAYLQYINYRDIDLLNAATDTPPQLLPLLSMIRSLSAMQTMTAKDGMLRSDSVFHIDITEDEIRDGIRGLLELIENPDLLTGKQVVPSS